RRRPPRRPRAPLARTGRDQAPRGERRPGTDRQLGRLRRPTARAADRAARVSRPPRDGTAFPARSRQAEKIEPKTTMANLHRRKCRGILLDRIMAPDTMAADFR